MSSTTTPNRTSTGRTTAQLFALLAGVVYLAVGIVGFFVTGFDQFAQNTSEAIWIFEVNPIHNIVHLALGGAFLFGATRARTATRTNFVLGFTLLAVFLLGILGAGTWLSIDAWYAPDNWLHLITGAAAIWFGRSRLEHDLGEGTTSRTQTGTETHDREPVNA